MTHAAGCPRPEPTTDIAGQLRCSSCHYLQTKTSVSNYRCRIHYDTPVSWKGTGCKPCASDAEKRAKPKDAEADPYDVTPRRIRP
jgi:hypothetical protein